MMMRSVVVAICAAAMLTACAKNGGISKQGAGTIVGGAIGGIAGHNVGDGSGRVAATIVGTLLGAALGSEIGESLDKADMNYYHEASQNALETGQPGQTLPWQNPDSDTRGSVTPANYYQEESGRYCREYTQTIVVGGEERHGYGTACRQPDGSWEIIK